MYQFKKTPLYYRIKELRQSYGDELVLVTDDEQYSWNDMYAAIGGTIKQLVSLGVKRGDMVGLRATKSAQTIFNYIALFTIGAVVAACDCHFTADSFLKGVKVLSDCNFTLSDEEGVWKLKSLKDGKEGVLSDTRCSDEKFLDGIADQCDVFARALLMFTAGSTSVSKGVLLSQYGIVNNAGYQVWLQRLEHSDCTFIAMPFYHVFGVAAFVSNILAGTKMILTVNDRPAQALEYIEKYKCTTVDGVPTYHLGLIEHQKTQQRDISSLKKGIIAGGNYTAEQFMFIEDKLGTHLVPSYGMTEASTVIASMAIDEDRALRSSSAGRFSPFIDGVLKDGYGNKVTQTEKEGEICVRGEPLMLGYYKNPAAEKQAIDSEGYFHTGDIGYLDKHGCLHISGRIKDIIIRGGENLSPAKIEGVICSLAGVADACVVGQSHSYYGEIPCAAIQPSADITVEQVIELLKGKLSKIEMPAKFVLVEKIPQLPSGKHDKAAVKKLFD